MLGRYRTTETGLYEFVRASSLPPEYPVVVRDGWAEFDLTGTRADLEEFRSLVEAVGASHELCWLVRTDDDAGVTTDRQRDALETALRLGYFEVPRECTLSEVADALDVDESTASGILRRGEARVLKWHLTGARDGPRP